MISEISTTVCVLRVSGTVCQLRNSETVCVKLKLIIEATSWDSNVSHQEASSIPLVLLVNNRFRSRGPKLFILFTQLLYRGHVIYFYQMPPGGAVIYTLRQSQRFYQKFFLHSVAVTEFLLFWIMCLFSSDFYYGTVWSSLWNMRFCCQSNCSCLWLVIHSKPCPFYVHVLTQWNLASPVTAVNPPLRCPICTLTGRGNTLSS